MKNVVQRLVIFASIFLGACATPSQTPYRYPTSDIRQINAPFFDQASNYCGPAALASILNFYGKPITVDEAASKVYSPKAKGSLNIEVGAAPRHWGFVSYPLAHSFDSIVQEVSANHPVLVLQNLGFSWWPQWHYATAVGFDPASDELILHSGHIANYRIARRTFMNTWRRSEYWARVIVPPSQAPATAMAADYLASISALEQSGHKDDAIAAYQTAAMRYPNNSTAQLMTANALLANDQADAAHWYFLAALRTAPKDATIWNNFAYAMKQSGCEINAQRAITVASTLAPNDVNIRSSVKELTKNDSAYVQRVACPSVDDIEQIIPR